MESLILLGSMINYRRTPIRFTHSWLTGSLRLRSSSSLTSSSKAPSDDSELTQLCDEVMSNECSRSNQIKELCSRYTKADPTTKHAFLLKLAKQYTLDTKKSIASAKSFLDACEKDNGRNNITSTAGNLGDGKQGGIEVVTSLDHLRSCLLPSYLTLFHTIFKVPDGIRFLVNLRADLLDALSLKKKEKESQRRRDDDTIDASDKDNGKGTIDLHLIQSMEKQLRSVLSIAFSMGFLHVHRVTWDSPAALIEKIAAHEAVHPVLNWIDIKNRLGPGRRCYVFTHPSLPGEPLVILHVALTTDIHPAMTDILLTHSLPSGSGITTTGSAILSYSGMTSSSSPSLTSSSGSSTSSSSTTSSMEIPSPLPLTAPVSLHKTIVDHHAVNDDEEEDLKDANTALFYSISSPQKGLNGIELGMQMIREVTQRISDEFPNITQFSTLSPIPGFRDHLLTEIERVQQGKQVLINNFFREEELLELEDWLFEQAELKAVNVWDFICDVVKTNSWIHDEYLSNRLKIPMMRKCAHYLYSVKEEKGYAINSVANFHMKNGAIMFRLNWRADLSPRGLANSCGLMVNYRYYLDQYEANGKVYQKDRNISISDAFKQTLEL